MIGVVGLGWGGVGECGRVEPFVHVCLTSYLTLSLFSILAVGNNGFGWQWLSVAVCGCLWLPVAMAVCGCLWLLVPVGGRLRLPMPLCGCLCLSVAATACSYGCQGLSMSFWGCDCL